ncbi:MAG: hypothetical protein A4E27_00166 [Methanobacterium sp. PtaU1.Bin242]|nr:MAG: hypothetical protein A4E27_00166 [Methanobacterium sp. PtaU1.Bin242]
MDYKKAWNELKELYKWKIETVENVEDRGTLDKVITECDKHVLKEMERIEKRLD